jgi:hypothetical protein
VLLLAATTSAGAVDPEDCCADLEERIAELEATAARKGNRKVSLVISGTINQSALTWYDGKASNVYTVTNDNDRSRFSFVSKFEPSADWQFGYHLEIGIKAANSLRVNQLSPQGVDNRGDFGADIRDSFWYLLGKRFGALIIGTTFAATDRIADSNVTQTNAFAKLLGNPGRRLRDVPALFPQRTVDEERSHVAPLDRRGRRPTERKPAWLRAHQVCDAQMERLERDWNVGCRRFLGRGNPV